MTIRSAKISLPLFVVMALVLMLCSHQATATELREPHRSVPTTITSDRMDYDANAQTVLFLGNVHVKRPDFELWSEKMTIYLDKSGKNNADAAQSGIAGMEAGTIERIIAEKKVRLKSEDITGTCAKATYYAAESKFVMEGSPILKDNKQNTITGTTIVHYLTTNRSQVIGGGTATFFSDDRTQQ